MRAHAAVAVAAGRVEFQDVEVPEPGPEDVVVRVTHSWISNGTEGSFVRGERIAGDTPRSEADPLPFPHVPGYQKVGIVEHVGSMVDDFNVGDVVFATVSNVEGMFYPTGGHVSPAVTHGSQVWKLPADVDPVAYSGMVLTQVGYNVGMRAPVSDKCRAIVIGDGMVGHWAAQTLESRGALALMLGKHPNRLSVCRPTSGRSTIDINAGDAKEQLERWCAVGVNVVADTVGSVSAVEALFPYLKHDSHIVSAGFYGSNGSIDIQKLRAKEITLHTPAGWSKPRMDATLNLIANGTLHTLPLITHRFAAQRAGEAFDLILSRREHVLGVVLDWRQ